LIAFFSVFLGLDPGIQTFLRFLQKLFLRPNILFIRNNGKSF